MWPNISILWKSFSGKKQKSGVLLRIGGQFDTLYRLNLVPKIEGKDLLRERRSLTFTKNQGFVEKPGKILIFTESQMFCVIRVSVGHNGRLHAKFQPFISIFRTKCIVSKIWCYLTLYRYLTVDLASLVNEQTLREQWGRSEYLIFHGRTK